MSHCKAYLTATSKVIGKTVFSWGIVPTKRQNATCNVRGFLFGMSTDIPALKVLFF